jgi:FKBP-type peptidyl-prolyl cis-trans isomerase FklB
MNISHPKQTATSTRRWSVTRPLATFAVAALCFPALRAIAQQISSASGSAGQNAAPNAQTTPAKPSGATGTTKSSQGTSGAAKARTGTAAKPAPLTLKTDKDKQSYAVGMSVGKNLKKDSVDVDPAILLRGIRDGIAGGKMLLTDDEAKAALTALQSDVRKRQEAKLQVLGETNKQEGEAFLTANKSQEGVMTLPDGLQYKVLQAGAGPRPTASDTVVCNYRGTLLNNKEFDSSYKRGQPATFPVSGVIKGWTEALQLMPVGSKWQVFVPSDLAYGPRGAGADIGPNSTLVFEIELLSIQSKDVKPAQSQ